MTNPKTETRSAISFEHLSHSKEVPKPGNFFRRMAAIFYDSILLFSLLFFSSIPLLVLFEKTTGQHLYEHTAYYGFVLWLYLVAFVYFGWFWTKTGQTPGMKAWHLRLTTEKGLKINWMTALQRYLGALLSWAVVGLGFLWILLSKSNKTWHGTLSGTRIFLDK